MVDFIESTSPDLSYLVRSKTKTTKARLGSGDKGPPVALSEAAPSHLGGSSAALKVQKTRLATGVSKQAARRMNASSKESMCQLRHFPISPSLRRARPPAIPMKWRQTCTEIWREQGHSWQAKGDVEQLPIRISRMPE